MQLTRRQVEQVLLLHGIYVKEVCGRCTSPLGPVRFTRQGEGEARCSRACRDGVDHNPGICRGCRVSLAGKRQGAIYCDRTCRMRTVRKEARDRANIVNMPIQDKGVVDTILAFG